MVSKELLAFILPALMHSLSPAKALDPVCATWFENSKIKLPSNTCIDDCSVLKVDLGTFHCPSKCQDMCNTKSGKTGLSDILYYPGLTAAEKQLVKMYPNEAIVGFMQKERAEFSQARNFPSGKFNDESDAFRHFIWAGLLTKALGAEKAKQFLDAHEENPDQPLAEKSMDLANNRAGILAAETLSKTKMFELKTLEATALRELKAGHLIVLEPGLAIPKEPQ